MGVSLVILGTVIVTVVVGALLARYVLFPEHFEPVQLDAAEEQVLEQKLDTLGVRADSGPRHGPGDRFAPRTDEFDAQGRLRPEPYDEPTDGPREVHFDERELNALIARDPELARRLAIDLSRDLVSVKLLVPLPPDFPVMGGQTLRLTAGAEVHEVVGRDGQPRLAVIVTGVSLWGVPLPNAWIGGLKGVDLVEQFGDDPGFWRALADGVESVQVEEGELVLRLAE
nr:hypothetical protein [Guyparkeria hydrothermalis]